MASVGRVCVCVRVCACVCVRARAGGSLVKNKTRSAYRLLLLRALLLLVGLGMVRRDRSRWRVRSARVGEKDDCSSIFCNEERQLSGTEGQFCQINKMITHHERVVTCGGRDCGVRRCGAHQRAEPQAECMSCRTPPPTSSVSHPCSG
jgi:hypothetical protein